MKKTHTKCPDCYGGLIRPCNVCCDDGFLELTTITIDGHNDAIMGRVIPGSRTKYSVRKIVKKLMSRDGMTREDALEFFYYNIAGSFSNGPTDPKFIDYP